MATILIEKTPTKFIGAVLTLLLNTTGLKSQISTNSPCPQNCIHSYLVNIYNSSSNADLSELLSFIYPDALANISNFIVHVFYYLHEHTIHSSNPCPLACIYHYHYYLSGCISYSCPASHVFYQNNTLENFHETNHLSRIDAFKHFSVCPSIIKTVSSAADSLVCCYTDKIISNYMNDWVCKCPAEACGEDSIKKWLVDTLPSSLIFQVDYSRAANLIEKLRLIAGFPNNFDSGEMFEIRPSENFTIVGYVFSKQSVYSAAVYNTNEQKWMFVEEGNCHSRSKFELVKMMVLENYVLEIVVYNKGLNHHIDLKDNMWISIENSIQKLISSSHQPVANVSQPWIDVYWTCIKCKSINFSSEHCVCGNEFSPKSNGWVCLCSRKTFGKSCVCGNYIGDCSACDKKNLIMLKDEIQRCAACKKWKCSICTQINKLPLELCVNCSNPNEKVFDHYKFLSLP